VEDLLMVDPKGDLNFSTRVARLCDLVASMSDKLNEKKFYFANVGIAAYQAVALARKAIDLGCGGILVNSFTMGIGGVEHLVEEVDGKIPVISTNMGSGIMSRGSWLGTPSINPTGMSEAVIAKLSRVAGADAVHTGTSASECYGEEAWSPASRSLSQDLHTLRPSMAVAEGDLTVANLWDNISSLGKDLLIEPTSGIINYPAGPGKGAEAFRILVDQLDSDMPNEEAHKKIASLASKIRHLGDALSYFGYSPEGKR
jgi:ribulose 1,5-bisphosphate carboxylase large subunit-like protein